ncbi:Na/Pi cotransporter family protein [Sporolituus thermophilus]|uniref:Phosphate:Na+ symporter n=1 Tax=Sporolituus thermophilus DSM 23256 TaxID=1123285 RepID=A0A1G7IA33_9FIRM|nr:Na/Pi symporter [Sporolituus thermophilus]SDF09448.1 phosphate:Na+ symporter [Sporolituus thermophilus DSM 23256]
MYILIVMLAGVGMLVGGIFLMRFGLKRLLWRRFQRLLQSMTVTAWRGLLVGTAAAALMQSSTAVSLITIGLVSAEYLTFYQGIGIILGANIGTCSTVQLLTLSLPDSYFLFLLVLSLVMAVFCQKLRYVSLAIAGLASMFLGLGLISDLLGQLPQIETIIDYLTRGQSNPLYGILGGIILTFLFQSSSAATGALMVLAADGIIDLTTAAYVVYGNNIGSCLSSVIVGSAAPLAAKRVAAAHIVLNVAGVLIFLPLTGLLTGVASWITADFGAQVAMVHTLFNILSSLAVLPFIRQFARLITALVPERG